MMTFDTDMSDMCCLMKAVLLWCDWTVSWKCNLTVEVIECFM